MILLHGTHDTVTPYANGVLLYDRAVQEGVPVELITIQGEGHMIEQEFLANYLDVTTESIYELITKGAEEPEGC